MNYVVPLGATDFVLLNCMDDESYAPGLALATELRRGAASQAGMRVRVFDCPTQAHLIIALREVADDAARGAMPMIHVDGHGTKEGLLTGNRDLVLWQAIWPQLRTINRAIKNNLVFTVGACESAWGVLDDQVRRLSDAAPFLILVAPQKVVSEHTVDHGFKAYYEEAIASGDLTKAFSRLTAIDRASPTYRGEYRQMIAPQLFHVAASKYIAQYCVGPGARAREAELAQHGGGRREFLIKAQKAVRGPQGKFLSRMYERFMMIDAYPDQKDRFRMNFGKLEADARKSPEKWRLV